MNAVDTALQPPPLSTLGPWLEESDVEVTVSIMETDGTQRTASLVVPDPSDAGLADALLECVRGVGSMRGPGLAAALRDRRLR